MLRRQVLPHSRDTLIREDVETFAAELRLMAETCEGGATAIVPPRSKMFDPRAGDGRLVLYECTPWVRLRIRYVDYPDFAGREILYDLSQSRSSRTSTIRSAARPSHLSIIGGRPTGSASRDRTSATRPAGGPSKR